MGAGKWSVLGGLALAAALPMACSDSGGDLFGPGTEGGECIDGDGCDPGLVCNSGTCESTDAGTTTGTGGTPGAGGGTSGSPGAGGSGTGGASTGGASAGGAPGAGGGSAGGSQCTINHPLLDAGARFCAPGECFCSNPDSCFPMAVAAGCCDAPVDCSGNDGGVACMGVHPEVQGDRRFCLPGRCYCARLDACFPTDSARQCCGGDVVCP